MTGLRQAGRVKRRLLWVLALVALVIAGAGFWFYNFYFSSTEAAVRHAEAFLFRRMTVAQLAEQGQYRFFYVTNRRYGAEGASIAERFGTEREEDLKFGTFDAEIRPSLGLGMFINPTEWFQNEEIQLHNVESVEQADFVAQLREQVKNSPDRGLLVVVHGFREAYKSALGKTAFVGHILDINAPVMLFDWPGNQGSSLNGYRRARQVARDSGAELAATLEMIIEEVQPDSLWLIANSMGGEVVAQAFGILNQNPALADAQTEIEDVVLTAPDVSHEEFDQQFKQEINALATNLTVYVSSNDRALIDLALPIFSILAAQFVVVAAISLLVVFRLMGRNYDAAVVSAGFGGYALGATPVAMANMSAVTIRYGASHMAFIIVPLVAAFFIDLVNALMIPFFLANF